MDIEFSILVGRVGTQDTARILECLAALRRQVGAPAHEVVIIDRVQDAVTATIRREHPEVVLVDCAAETTLPVMRRLALERASGAYAVVTEDHCIPDDDWLQSFRDVIRAAPADAVAFGGCVENGVHDTALDWATFFCEYANCLSPRPDGYATDIPGMNIAYRRAALSTIPTAQLDRGFWETTVHPELERGHQRLYSSNRIRIRHCKKFSLGHFCRQRFLYSRYHSGIRFPAHAQSRRFSAALLSLALPPVLFWRMANIIFAKQRLRREFLRASPYLALFCVVWAIGDVAGYLLGAGNALREIE